MNQKKTTGILLVIILMSIIAFAYVMSKLIAINSECQSNPFVYGAKEIKKQGYSVQCSCSFKDQRLQPFTFNEDGIIVKEDPKEFFYNLTLFNISENG